MSRACSSRCQELCGAEGRREDDLTVAVGQHQHSSRVADEAIAGALDARLTERKFRPAPKCHGPVESRTEPQLVPSSRDIRERASDQG
jgi:hypothetical protein